MLLQFIPWFSHPLQPLSVTSRPIRYLPCEVSHWRARPSSGSRCQRRSEISGIHNSRFLGFLGVAKKALTHGPATPLQRSSSSHFSTNSMLTLRGIILGDRTGVVEAEYWTSRYGCRFSDTGNFDCGKEGSLRIAQTPHPNNSRRNIH